MLHLGRALPEWKIPAARIERRAKHAGVVQILAFVVALSRHCN